MWCLLFWPNCIVLQENSSLQLPHLFGFNPVVLVCGFQMGTTHLLMFSVKVKVLLCSYMCTLSAGVLLFLVRMVCEWAFACTNVQRGCSCLQCWQSYRIVISVQDCHQWRTRLKCLCTSLMQELYILFLDVLEVVTNAVHLPTLA